MKTPLVKIEILSIYEKQKHKVLLPDRMAKCTPDTYKAIMNLKTELEGLHGKLILSDLFRSYDMQLQSHLDWKNKKKTAFSPPPGGSLHEAGRALDLDLGSIKITLAKFWPLAAKHGFFPIIDKPDPKMKEAWHFDRRGSHQKIYEYYTVGKGKNFKPYTAMAASAILSINVKVDAFANSAVEASIQSGLIRLGHELGNMDGAIGNKTRNALEQAGIPWTTKEQVLDAIESQLQDKFPEEYTVPDTGDESDIPGHVIQ